MHTFRNSISRAVAGVVATASLGFFTMPQAVLAAVDNTALGTNALHSNTSGSFNSAFGYGALYSNTTGFENTANGFQALYSNISGFDNVASGNNALYFNAVGSNNTATGVSALYLNNGNYNTANGLYALLYNGSGSSNTAIGNNALYNSTGDNNIGIGDGAGYSIITGSNNIEIGAAGGSSDDGVIRIGSGQATTMIAGIWSTTIPGGVQVYINKYGHLGTMTSSRRFKEDIRTIDAISDKLLQLRPVSFRYKQAADDGSRPLQYGLIAEEVAKVYPELVQYDKDRKPYTVSYNFLPPLLLSALQKEHAANLSRQDMLVSQQAEIEKLNQQLMAQQAEMHVVLKKRGAAAAALQQKLSQLQQILQAYSTQSATRAKVALAANR